MSSFATATIVGNLGKKPEVKQAGDKRFARFSLAVNRKTREGQTTAWFDVVCWDEKKVEVLESYADKGTKLLVTGELERREFTKQDGSKGVAFEVVIGRFGGTMLLLPSGGGGGEAGARTDRKPAIADMPADDIPW